MVKYRNILKTIDSYVKCHDYPKAVAMREFDPLNYKDEEWDTYPKQIPSPQGKLQRIQENLQKNIDYSRQESIALRDYQTTSYLPLNQMLNGRQLPTSGKDLFKYELRSGVMGGIRDKKTGKTSLSEEAEGEFVTRVRDGTFDEDGEPNYVYMSMPEEDRLISSAIDKSPTLQDNTILYSYRQLPLTLKVGDHGTLKGYSSTSYNPYVIENIMEKGEWVIGSEDHRFKCKIYAPKGTRGLVLNEQTSGKSAWQSEWLLDKNQKYFVRSINYETMEAEIVLY